MPLFRRLRQWLTRVPSFQGRNLAGRVGLFPQSYTQPAPPTSSPPPEVAAELADSPISPVPYLPKPDPHEASSPPATNGDAQPTHTTAKGNGEVMRATMTDVQKAIEQLGHKDDFD